MSEVRIEVMPMLAPYFGSPGGGHLVVSEAIEERETLRELLNRLVEEHRGLDDVVFDVRAQQLTEYVRVIVNGEMVELGGGLETALTDGDTILFLPAFAGGVE